MWERNLKMERNNNRNFKTCSFIFSSIFTNIIQPPTHKSKWAFVDLNIKILYASRAFLNMTYFTLDSIKGKGKAHPCTCTQALHRPYGPKGSRGIALPFHDHGTRRGWGVSVTSRPLFTPRKDPVPIVQKAGWTPGPGLTGVENLAPYRDSIPGPSSP